MAYFPAITMMRLQNTILFFYFDVAIRMALDEHRQEKDIKLAYLHDAEIFRGEEDHEA